MPRPTRPDRRYFLSPRYWPTWFAVALLRLVVRLPYRLQMQLGALLGRLALRALPARRRVAQTNLALCFPALDAAEQAALLAEHFKSLGKGVVETALAWWGDTRPLENRCVVIGERHLRDALAPGKGVILLSAHFTTLEIGGRLLAARVPFHVVYRRYANPLLETLTHAARTRRFEKAIPKSDARALLVSLKAGMPVWYAPDQHAGGPNSTFAPFFGVPASTLTTTSRVARISGAPVVPFFQTRLPGDRGYLLVLCPPLENFPSDDVALDTARLNRLFEETIREMPAQYLWVHRRFKTMPDGGASPYFAGHGQRRTGSR